MKTYLLLQNQSRTRLPPELQSGDVRYPESLVEHSLREYTREGDTVLDPFAGFGTTLHVAEEMGRIPYGIEYESAKVECMR
jgi:DNA modification methylase